MPQFDFYSFSTQVFWVLISFAIIYFFLLQVYIINFSSYNKSYEKIKTKFNS